MSGYYEKLLLATIGDGPVPPLPEPRCEVPVKGGLVTISVPPLRGYDLGGPGDPHREENERHLASGETEKLRVLPARARGELDPVEVDRARR